MPLTHPIIRRCLPEELCRRLFQQLIMAVDYCHRLGIANRDIKVGGSQLRLGYLLAAAEAHLKHADQAHCMCHVTTFV